MEKEEISSDVKNFVDIMDLDELVKLSEYVYKRIKFLGETMVFERIQGFEVLDKVSFVDNSGNILKGTVVRLNKRTVTVKSDEGRVWLISPFLLDRLV